jgi:peptide/nickel transport system permease protein
MLSFLAKRLAQLIPTLFFVSILIFSLQQCCPAIRRLSWPARNEIPA